MAQAPVRRRGRGETVFIEKPRAARWLFGSSQAASIWLVARLWLGWEWFQSGWGKVAGGSTRMAGGALDVGTGGRDGHRPVRALKVRPRCLALDPRPSPVVD